MQKASPGASAMPTRSRAAHSATGQTARRRVDLAEQLGVGQCVHGRAVGMVLGRPRQPGIDEHEVARYRDSRTDSLPNYQAS